MKQFLTKSYNVKIYYFYQYFTILITNETNPCKILHCRVENTQFAKNPIATAVRANSLCQKLRKINGYTTWVL